jgi:hypothetical protein
MMAIREQERLGWDKMLYRFISIHWRKVQEEYMVLNKKIHSPVGWMAKFQKQLWEFAWTMWDTRNTHLNSDGTKIHKCEYNAINSEIIAEWTIGQGSLGKRFKHLFRGTIQKGNKCGLQVYG